MSTEDYFANSKFVQELSAKDFNSTAPWKLASGGNAMVLFYAPWCGFCKATREPWEKAAKVSGFCDFFAFNCEKNKAHLEKIRADMPQLVRGYPTIIMYKNGEPDEYYNGERTQQEFTQACMRLCGDGKCKIVSRN